MNLLWSLSIQALTLEKNQTALGGREGCLRLLSLTQQVHKLREQKAIPRWATSKGKVCQSQRKTRCAGTPPGVKWAQHLLTRVYEKTNTQLWAHIIQCKGSDTQR